MAKKPSNAGAALLKHGWVFIGLCGACKNRMKKWQNPQRKGEEIRTARNLGYFYHYVGQHVVKSDYLVNLPAYLKTL